MNFHEATADDIGQLIDIQAQAQAWRGNLGELALSEEIDRAVLQKKLEIHMEISRIFIAELHGRVVGSLRLQTNDTAFWGPEGDDGQAGYIHGLALVDGAHGRGLGRLMLNWAETEIQSWGRKLARLDCRAENKGLCAYYTAANYRDKGITTLDSGWRAQKFEKALVK